LSDSEKIIIWYKILHLLDRVFSELFETILDSHFCKVLKLVWSFSFFTH